MSRVTGALYLAGSLALLTLTLTTTSDRSTLALGVVAGVASTTGALIIAVGRHIPRWGYHGLVAMGTNLIAIAVVVAPDPVVAVAAAGVGTFVALDAFFFFAWPAALAHLGYLNVTLTWAWSSQPGGGPLTIIALDVVYLAVAAVVGVLVQRASHASRDSLTGLLNRRGFDDALTDLLHTARRTGHPLSAALLDLDHFKAVNDAGGHAAGDELLQTAALQWRQELPPNAVLARYGGDEFAMLLPDHSGPVALAVMEQLRTQIPPIAVSCGVTQWQHRETGSQLMRRADRALYQAKTAGRGRSLLDDADPDPLLADLTAALDGGDPTQAGLTVHYQAIVTPDNGAVVGVESLARWTHPTRGAISPARFISLAEEHGLIDQLGTWILRRACADLAALRATTGVQLMLTVNVSGHQLCNPDFPDHVHRALADSGWPARATVLEVTENVMEAESPGAVTALTSLRQAGIRIAIDDFGTGYSSLARLDTLQADLLKLDDTFIASVTSSPRRAALLHSVTAMADALGMHLIAEGVETRAQARHLQQLGCRYAQGFYYHRPTPIDGVLLLLANPTTHAPHIAPAGNTTPTAPRRLYGRPTAAR